MSEYKGIKGFNVQTRTEDPSPTEVQTGDFYYNSVTGTFKNIVIGVGTWSSGGDVNTARTHGGGAGDSNSAALFIAGQEPTPSSHTFSKKCESYNGSSWQEVGDTPNNIHYLTGTGSYTAAIVAGGNRQPEGDNSNQADTWNGTAWTEIGNLIVGRNGVALFGTQTSAIGASGYSPATSPSYSLNVEQWNGTAWAEIAEVNYGKYGAAAAGTSISAGLAFGGENPGMPAQQQNTEEWNGASWTEVADMSTTRSWVWSGGTSTDALVSGGQPVSANTEHFNGTSWTELNNLSGTKSYAGGKCGVDSTSCIWASGSPSPPSVSKSVATEEWTKPDFEIKSVTTS